MLRHICFVEEGWMWSEVSEQSSWCWNDILLPLSWLYGLVVIGINSQTVWFGSVSGLFVFFPVSKLSTHNVVSASCCFSWTPAVFYTNQICNVYMHTQSTSMKTLGQRSIIWIVAIFVEALQELDEGRVQCNFLPSFLQTVCVHPRAFTRKLLGLPSIILWMCLFTLQEGFRLQSIGATVSWWFRAHGSIWDKRRVPSTLKQPS